MRRPRSSVSDRQFEVFGRGNVIVFDARAADVKTVAKGENQSATDIRMSVLRAVIISCGGSALVAVMFPVRRAGRAQRRLEPIEKASVDELRALQLERLRWSLRHAYENVAHYRQPSMQQVLRPPTCTRSRTSGIPVPLKQDFRKQYPFGLFAVPRERLVRLHASSGTTGKPTVVGYTQRDIDTWAGLVARSIFASGGRPGDIVHIA